MNGKKAKDWQSTNIRQGANPLELQQMERNGQLNPHMNVRLDLNHVNNLILLANG